MGEIISLTAEELPADCYVFKHSTQCGRSAAAAAAVKAHSFPLPLYWINVIEQRPLSNWVAAGFQVAHESPQLLALRGGKVVKVWNHSAIAAALAAGGPDL